MMSVSALQRSLVSPVRTGHATHMNTSTLLRSQAGPGRLANTPVLIGPWTTQGNRRLGND